VLSRSNSTRSTIDTLTLSTGSSSLFLAEGLDHLRKIANFPIPALQLVASKTLALHALHGPGGVCETLQCCNAGIKLSVRFSQRGLRPQPKDGLNYGFLFSVGVLVEPQPKSS
jgi:hypothetical protein